VDELGISEPHEAHSRRESQTHFSPASHSSLSAPGTRSTGTRLSSRCRRPFGASEDELTGRRSRTYFLQDRSAFWTTLGGSSAPLFKLSAGAIELSAPEPPLDPVKSREPIPCRFINASRPRLECWTGRSPAAAPSCGSPGFNVVENAGGWNRGSRGNAEAGEGVVAEYCPPAFTEAVAAVCNNGGSWYGV
jgi:hypothetical protein